MQLSSEQTLLQESAARFFARECRGDRLREWMEAGTALDAELWAAMAEQGYHAFLVPERCGGLGLGPVEAMLLAEEAGRAGVPGPYLSNLWGSCLLGVTASDPRHERLLRGVCQGRARIAVACLEAAGSPGPFERQLEAIREGDAWQVDGSEVQVVDAELADALLIAARDADGRMLLVLVPQDAPGISLTRLPRLDAARPHSSIRFKGVRVDKEDVLVADAEAEAALRYSTSVARAAATADRLGAASSVLAAALEFVRERGRLGEGVAVFADVELQAADALATLGACRADLYAAAADLGAGGTGAHGAVLAAVSSLSETATKVGQLVEDRQEGMGLGWEQDLRLFRTQPPFHDSLL